MSRTTKILNSLAYLVGVGAIAVISYQSVVRAQHKFFWVDEAFELLHSCTDSSLATLLHGAQAQCSPQPLYYFLEMILVKNLNFTGSEMLIHYRLVSLISAALSLVVLFYVISKRLGPAFGLLSLTLMNSQPLFWQFAAENRPYMLWILFFVCLTSFVTASSCFENPLFKKMTVLALLCICLSLVAGAGIVQVSGFLITLFFLDWFSKSKMTLDRKKVRTLVGIFILCLVLDLVYALQGCKAKSAGQWDLIDTGNLRLIRDVTELLWPPQRSLATLIFNILFVMGALGPILKWKGEKLTKVDFFTTALSLSATIQIGCAVILGFLVAQAHYYFIPRVFIYLIVLRAVLVVAGARWVTDLLFRRVKFVPLKEVVIMGLGVLVTISSIKKSQDDLNWFSRQPSLGQFHFLEVPCDPLHRPIGTIRANDVAEDWQLNFAVVLADELKKCPKAQDQAPGVYYLPYRDSNGAYSYVKKASLSGEQKIFLYFGRPIPEVNANAF